MWVPFACLLVPAVLWWTGTGTRTALAVGVLLGVLAAVCLAVLTLAGAWRQPPPDDGADQDDVRR